VALKDGDGADQLLRRAWPEGVPPAELAFLRSLPERRAEIVRRRLTALLAADGNPAPDLTEIATSAGLSRTLFYNLRKRWSKNKSLRSISPYQPRSGGGAEAPDGSRPDGDAGRRHSNEAEAALAEILADPLANNGQIASRVAVSTRTALDRRTLVKIVQRERRLLHFRPLDLLPVYGRSLLADITAVEIALEEDEHLEVAVLAMLIERATGLVLGHAVGTAQDGIALQVKAALRAVAFLAEHRADTPLGTPVDIRVVVGPAELEQVARIGDTLARHLGRENVVSVGWRRFGERAASLIGQPGRVRLRPMATMPQQEMLDPSRIPGPRLSRADADALLGTELARHNRSALDGLRVVGLAGGGEAAGAMSRRILEVFGNLLA
jgi:hypothetical protein